MTARRPLVARGRGRCSWASRWRRCSAWAACSTAAAGSARWPSTPSPPTSWRRRSGAAGVVAAAWPPLLMVVARRRRRHLDHATGRPPRSASPPATPGRRCSTDLDDAWRLYQDVVAPAPVAPGFVLASCLAIWVVAYVADWAAFRLWVPFEATLPAGTLFLFTRCSARPRGRGWAVALYADRRARRSCSCTAWPARTAAATGSPTDASIGNRSLLDRRRRARGRGRARRHGPRAGRPGRPVPRRARPPVAEGRRRPGDGEPARRHPLAARRPGRRSRCSRCGVPERVVLAAHLARGVRRHASGRRAAASGRPTAPSPSRSRPTWPPPTFEQTFTISVPGRDLAAQRLRAPGPRRRRASRSATTRTRPPSSSTTTSTTSDGLTYRVTSRLAPHHARGPRRAPRDEIPDDIRDRFLELPDGFSPSVRALAQEITDGADHPAEQARALQDYLRTLRLLARRCSAGTARTRSRTSSSRTRRATASSSPAPSRRWPARSASRPASRSASPRARRTPTTPGSTTCAASTPTPGPRCTSRARAGCSTSPRPAAARRTPRPTRACPSSRPPPATPEAP